MKKGRYIQKENDKRGKGGERGRAARKTRSRKKRRRGWMTTKRRNKRRMRKSELYNGAKEVNERSE